MEVHRVGTAAEVRPSSHVGHDAESTRVAAGEGDPEQLADGTPAAVAGGQIGGPQRPCVAVRDALGGRDARAVLRQAHQLVPVADTYPVAEETLFEQLLDPRLRNADLVGAPGRPAVVSQRHRQPGEMPLGDGDGDGDGDGGDGTLMRVVEQAAQIEHPGGAGLKVEGLCLDAALGQFVQHHHVDTRQRQFGGEQQPGRAAADHHDLGLLHDFVSLTPVMRTLRCVRHIRRTPEMCFLRHRQIVPAWR
ncbi:hypothetical protein R5U08_39040 [Streptomyces coeruleorubidus]|uniref:Uncharacterized protein n=1 Tax=Streptomyces coeruleorubidus TaxID=116188 RepID=A0ABZ0KRT9_STRC4|nr:hypothetical protein [Streptomyces coeruleorubidus]WOT40551.1 hypothetical protein R5U08_39040 [Streptomyces coeruleorubidus]